MASRSKITNIAAALRCASQVKQGKACSMADARATLMLLDTALKTSRRTARGLKQQFTQSDNMVTRLMAKIGL
ncbi:MAG TPA: hypothetical protein HPP54_10810 [Nitrospinae bacterium]|nr:hypothetical protein [Nitrospinota bacterium]